MSLFCLNGVCKYSLVTSAKLLTAHYFSTFSNLTALYVPLLTPIFEHSIAPFFLPVLPQSPTVTVICGIKNIHFLAPRFLVLLRVDSHQMFLVLVQQSVLGVATKLNLVEDLILAVVQQRNRVLFINPPVLNQLELNNIIMKNNLMTIVQFIPGMKRVMHMIASYKNGV